MQRTASLASLILALGACSSTNPGADAGLHPDDASTPVDAVSPLVDASDPATCSQAADFVDVSGGSAGPSYPAPRLGVDCTDTEVVVTSNGIPTFTFDPVTPNELVAQSFTFRFPRAPAPAATESEVPLGGPVAVAVDGLPIFGPTEAPVMGYRDPLLDALLDRCNGHTAPGGVYHYHARPECLFTDLEGNTHLVLAYAFDGYPILAPFECEGDACTTTRELRSSWQRVASQFDASGEPLYDGTTEGSWDIHEYVAGSGDLDRCNGRDLPGGGYAYYATDAFPYFVGCYRGTPTANAVGMGPPR